MLKRRQLTVVLVMAFSLQLGQAAVSKSGTQISASSIRAAENQASAETRTSEAQACFDKLVDQYFAAYFLANPNYATEEGIHDYDDKMPSYTKEATAARISELKRFKDEFEKIAPSTLTSSARLDRQMLIADAQANLLELESIQKFKHDPGDYSDTINSYIFSLIKRDYAPIEQRLKFVIAREKEVPQILASARENLTNVPKIYAEITLEQLPGVISFFQDAVPQAFASVKDEQLQKELKETNDRTIAELKEYGKYVKESILPHTQENFAIGKDNFQRKLAYEEMVDEPVDELRIRGYNELHRLQKEFVATAKSIDPSKAPAEVMVDVSSKHCKPDQLLSSVTNVLSELRDKSAAVVTLPGEADLRVQETPPFMRATTFASMDAPGPFEASAKEAYYQVTLPEKDWNAQRTEEHMRSFCTLDVFNTSVHEAYPGHYVQGLYLKQAPSKTRKLLGCSSNAEGWAHYCEELMADRQPDDKQLKLVQLHDALLRACRYIVGIEMHTNGMTLEQGKQFFIKEGYVEPANADRESKRGTSDPTYLVYTLGKLQLLALKDDYKKQMGDKFDLKQFHDQFLSQGKAPIKIVRKAMLNID